MPDEPTLDLHQRAMLDVTLDRWLAGEQRVTGRRLRHASAADDPRSTLESLVPAYLSSWTGTSTDEYSLRLRGLLATRLGSRAEHIIAAVLHLLREEFQSDPDFKTFTWTELRDRGLAADDIPLLGLVLDVAHLSGGGPTRADETSTWLTRWDIEELVQCKSASDLLSREDAASARRSMQRQGESGGRQKEDKFRILDAPRQLDADIVEHQDVPLGLVFLDIDNFKALNTRFTETLVDRDLLPPFLGLIEALTKERGFAYQQGGDEVTVLLVNSQDLSSAAIAEEFRRVVEAAEFRINGDLVPIRVSVGLATTTTGTVPDDLLPVANLAEHEAKEAGGNRVVLGRGGSKEATFDVIEGGGILSRERLAGATRAAAEAMPNPTSDEERLRSHRRRQEIKLGFRRQTQGYKISPVPGPDGLEAEEAILTVAGESSSGQAIEKRWQWDLIRSGAPHPPRPEMWSHREIPADLDSCVGHLRWECGPNHYERGVTLKRRGTARGGLKDLTCTLGPVIWRNPVVRPADRR